MRYLVSATKTGFTDLPFLESPKFQYELSCLDYSLLWGHHRPRFGPITAGFAEREDAPHEHPSVHVDLVRRQGIDTRIY
jgi:hypothetical protein